MLLTIGDLVEDVVVYLGGPVLVGSDTNSRIERRRGGSAANVAEVAAMLGHGARFVGRVGDDSIGAALIRDLDGAGVDVTFVQRGGRTGTIVVLVDEGGERTMLPDRAACLDLDDPDPAWLDGISTLHVPFYSFTDGRIRSTTRSLIDWAHDRGVTVSIDVSSVAIIEEFGADNVRALLEIVHPHVVMANADEADALDIIASIAGAVTVVKHGPDPVVVHADGRAVSVDVPPVGDVIDTTGAGDAFAAGFLAAWPNDPAVAAQAGCRAAATLFATRG